MKKIFRIWLFFLACTCTYSAHAQNNEAQFFSSLRDIPLMEGLIEIEENITTFDKPDGRIIDAYAAIENTNQDNILTYYNATLPQFGWSKTETNIFYRNREFLELSFETNEGTSVLKISIRPSL